MVSRAFRVSITLGAVIILFATSVFLSVFFAYTAINNNDHKLCTVINLVTAHPVANPGSSAAANPSREDSYRFYQAFLEVKKDYGC